MRKTTWSLISRSCKLSLIVLWDIRSASSLNAVYSNASRTGVLEVAVCWGSHFSSPTILSFSARSVTSQRTEDCSTCPTNPVTARHPPCSP